MIWRKTSWQIKLWERVNCMINSTTHCTIIGYINRSSFHITLHSLACSSISLYTWCNKITTFIVLYDSGYCHLIVSYISLTPLSLKCCKGSLLHDWQCTGDFLSNEYSTGTNKLGYFGCIGLRQLKLLEYRRESAVYIQDVVVWCHWWCEGVKRCHAE